MDEVVMAMLRYQGGMEMGKMGWNRTFSEKVTAQVSPGVLDWPRSL